MEGRGDMHQTTTDIEHQVIKMLDVAEALSSHSHQWRQKSGFQKLCYYKRGITRKIEKYNWRQSPIYGTLIGRFASDLSRWSTAAKLCCLNALQVHGWTKFRLHRVYAVWKKSSEDRCDMQVYVRSRLVRWLHLHSGTAGGTQLRKEKHQHICRLQCNKHQD